MLEIKAESVMLGYLNAPSTFAEDDWIKIVDVVEVDGEWLRILGRKSKIINVGGQKIYPAGVENIIQQMGGWRMSRLVMSSIPTRTNSNCQGSGQYRRDKKGLYCENALILKGQAAILQNPSKGIFYRIHTT